MPELPARKVGIVACSGEELAEGTVTRLAALKVLNELRPHDTVTICLPLFLAGGAGDRAFAKVHPTITVDGCALRCAARATEMYSSKPAASLVVNDLVAEHGLGKPEGRRRLNEAGRQAVVLAAQRLAALVDQVLGDEGPAPALHARAATGQVVGQASRLSGGRLALGSSDMGETPHAAGGTPAPLPEQREATCSCGSGLPVQNVVIDGKSIEVVALPLIFQKFRAAGRGQPEADRQELFETVKIYNAVPLEAEASYREAILREYTDYCQEKGGV
jgi:uncharacterized metal-binding protein